MHRGAAAHIDRASLIHNLGVVRTWAPGCAVYAVVKADAYGHGAVEVSKTLIAAGADRLAVAFCSEAAPLREAGIRKPILSLFDPDPDEVFRYNIIPVLNDFRAADLLSKAAVARDITLPVHVKVDTGMGRTGIISDPCHVIMEIAALKNLTVEGLTSHLSESESSDREYSYSQIARLKSLRLELAAKGLVIPCLHMSNSGGIMNLPEAHFDAVRPGLMLYGYKPGQKSGCAEERRSGSCSDSDRGPGSPAPAELVPVMRLTARILQLRRVSAGSPISYNRTFTVKRDSLIAAVSVGYADGYSVAFSNNSEVLVRGKRAPLIGRVCMDIIMIDMTEIDGVTGEDEVTLIGRQGEDIISAYELAARIKTHPYEILTALGGHARKEYI